MRFLVIVLLALSLSLDAGEDKRAAEKSIKDDLTAYLNGIVAPDKEVRLKTYWMYNLKYKDYELLIGKKAEVLRAPMAAAHMMVEQILTAQRDPLVLKGKVKSITLVNVRTEKFKKDYKDGLAMLAKTIPVYRAKAILEKGEHDIGDVAVLGGKTMLLDDLKELPKLIKMLEDMQKGNGPLNPTPPTP